MCIRDRLQNCANVVTINYNDAPTSYDKRGALNILILCILDGVINNNVITLYATIRLPQQQQQHYRYDSEKRWLQYDHTGSGFLFDYSTQQTSSMHF